MSRTLKELIVSASAAGLSFVFVAPVSFKAILPWTEWPVTGR
jgi:hypothetical protein